jgi:hypothetical protein
MSVFTKKVSNYVTIAAKKGQFTWNSEEVTDKQLEGEIKGIRITYDEGNKKEKIAPGYILNFDIEGQDEEKTRFYLQINLNSFLGIKTCCHLPNLETVFCAVAINKKKDEEHTNIFWGFKVPEIGGQITWTKKKFNFDKEKNIFDANNGGVIHYPLDIIKNWCNTMNIDFKNDTPSMIGK